MGQQSDIVSKVPITLIIRSDNMKSSRTSSGEAKIGTAGSTVEVKGLMVTACEVDDHEVD